MQDDLTGLKPHTPLVSRLLTEAKITLSADARTATLTLNGRTLRAEILCPATAKFTAAPANAPTAKERPNPGLTTLSAECTPTTPDARLALLLTPRRRPLARRPPAPPPSPPSPTGNNLPRPPPQLPSPHKLSFALPRSGERQQVDYSEALLMDVR